MGCCEMHALKKLAVKLTTATSIDQVKGQSRAEVLRFIRENLNTADDGRLIVKVTPTLFVISKSTPGAVFTGTEIVVDGKRLGLVGGRNYKITFEVDGVEYSVIQKAYASNDGLDAVAIGVSMLESDLIPLADILGVEGLYLAIIDGVDANNQPAPDKSMATVISYDLNEITIDPTVIVRSIEEVA